MHMYISPTFLYVTFALLIATASAVVGWRANQDIERGEGGGLFCQTSRRMIFPDGPLLAIFMIGALILFCGYWETLTGSPVNVDVFMPLFLLDLGVPMATLAAMTCIEFPASRKAA